MADFVLLQHEVSSKALGTRLQVVFIAISKPEPAIL
jgi:hypothetical protein